MDRLKESCTLYKLRVATESVDWDGSLETAEANLRAAGELLLAVQSEVKDMLSLHCDIATHLVVNNKKRDCRCAGERGGIQPLELAGSQAPGSRSCTAPGAGSL